MDSWSWVATLAIATFGPIFIWEEQKALTTFAIIINLANGVLMILANRQLFNHYDELEQNTFRVFGLNAWNHHHSRVNSIHCWTKPILFRRMLK